MQVEWGQLLIEQSAWASHSRVESIVIEQLKMAQEIVLVRQL